MTLDAHKSADQAMTARDPARATQILEAHVADNPGDFAAWMKIAGLRRAAGLTAGALAAANNAVDCNPHDFLALLLKGNLHEALNEEALAAEIYRAALYHAKAAPNLPDRVSQQLAAARAFLDRYGATVRQQMVCLRDMDAEHTARAHRFVENVLDRRPHYAQEPTHYRYPGLADIEYFDFAYPELRTRLKAAYPAIRAEFINLFDRHADQQKPYVDFAPGQPMGQWEPLNKSPKWNALHLIRYGIPDPVNAPACPQTMAAFAGQQPDIPDLAPNLMFSLLAPQTRIPPHHGVANFRVVLHLPIIVPARCAFRVGADTRPWQAGEPWIFDDTIEHEAWNESDELRVVLIGDLWRPELDGQDHQIIREFMAAQDAPTDRGAL